MVKVTYEYDKKNQLTREDNVYLGKTILYNYDNGGNILSKMEYVLATGETPTNLIQTINYGYQSGENAWKDQLISYNGESISYDNSGNPTTYRGDTLTWKRRQLRSYANAGGETITYKYDSDGLRTSKTVGDTVHNYYYCDGLLVFEDRGDYRLYFFYDGDGNLARIQRVTDSGYTGYYTTVNMRGDVEAIYNYQGNLVARYIYDSWGNTISVQNASGTEITSASNIGNQNPIRYRGYYYDVETGLYYLQSRYYDPEVGRFINADSQFNIDDGVLGLNIFAYCLNDPINQVEPLGTASCQNSYTVHKDNNGNILGYKVTTVVNINRTELKYKYYIKANGVIQFEFDENKYWSLLWRGGGMILAEAMYKQAKSINKNFLYGRTIGGLNKELQGHWAAYIVTGSERARRADMGAMIKGKRGYDSNAWFWESANAAEIISSINLFNVWGYVKSVRRVMRYI